MRSLLLCTSAAAFVLAGLAQAQTTVFSGDDLAAIVAAAPDGETITILSNDTFVGTLEVVGKTLWIEAGQGFTPTIQGDPGEEGIDLKESTAVTNVKCYNLRVRGGVNPDPNEEYLPVSVRAGGTGNVPEFTVGEFFGCELLDDISVGATGEVQQTFSFFDCELDGGLGISGTGNASMDLTIEGCTSGGRIRISGTGLFECDFDIRRLRSSSYFTCSENSSSLINGLIESSVFANENDAVGNVGISVILGADVDVVSCTSTGWTVGLRLDSPASGENLALFDNDLDVSSLTDFGVLSNSLLTDGSYTGFGTLQGQPVWNKNYAFLQGSVGIDQGNSNNGLLGILDVYGDNRIQDGDGDGVAKVNYGAVETVAPCAPAELKLQNGNDINPVEYEALNLPVLGQSFDAQIKTGSDTVLTLLAVDQLVSPFPLGGIEGEVLVGLTPNLYLDDGVALGKHVLPIPNDPNLCGATTGTQGLRVELDAQSGQVKVLALNGYELKFGS